MKILTDHPKIEQKDHIKIDRESRMKKISRWWELNPRPIPYQGIAIPLSHSGTVFFIPE